MARQQAWDDVNFAGEDYGPGMRLAIALAGERSRRLTRCSLCPKRRVAFGVLVHPALRRVEPPPGIRPRPFAVCRDHSALNADELGDALYGPRWRQYAGP
jgi:hypothetical protein